MNKISATDQSFLDALHKIIEENLVNEQFGVEELAREMAVSRSQLHRRIHALTGQSTSQLIREYRLEKARELLENKTATVAEVAYQVGFGSPSYFNTCFHEYFGYPPGEVKIRKSFEVKKKPLLTKKVALILIAILAVPVLIHYLMSITGISTDEVSHPSSSKIIAVAPFTHTFLEAEDIDYKNGAKEDSSENYIGDMISEEIRNHLSSYPEVRILKETSSTLLASMSSVEVRKSKTATHLIKGDYWKRDNEIIINAKILEVVSGNLQELRVQKTDFNQITKAIRDISNEAVEELNIKAATDDLYQLPTKNNDAYLSYYQGKHLLKLSGRNDIKKAITLLSKAIKIDPEFADAYASRANAHLLSAGWWGDNHTSTTLLLARNDIETALSLNPKLWEAYEVSGDLKFSFMWDYKAAEIDLKKAAEYNNGTSVAYGWFLWVTGRYDEAVNMHEKSILDDPGFSTLYADLGLALHLAGRKEEAFDMYKQGYTIAQDNFVLDAIMAQFLMLENKYDSALEYARHATLLDPERSPFDVPLQGMIYARMGDKENTLKIMQKMDEFELKGLKGWWGYSWAKFLMYAYLDDREKALQSLEESIRKREVIVIVTNAWLHFYDLESFKDEAYYKIMEDAGLYYDKYEE